MRLTPRIYAEALYEAVKAASEKEIHAIARRLLKLLQRRRHWAYLPKIMRAFDDVLYEREGMMAVQLTTAREHNATHEKEWVKRVLDQVLPAEGKRRIELERIVNAELIGGMKLKARGYVCDVTVRGWLEGLRLRLTS